METWRTWELVIPELERHHEVLAATLPGHAGGPAVGDDVTLEALVDAVETIIDDAGYQLPHIVGGSLGGYLALRLAARGRAAGVVAFAPAGFWAREDGLHLDLLHRQRELHAQMRVAAPQADRLLASVDGRRRATQLLATNFEHLPSDLLAHQMVGIATCRAAERLICAAEREPWSLDAEQVTCPVRIVWGAADRLLPWPRAAARLRDKLPNADLVILDDAGHSPQLDVPLEAAQLILGVTRTPPRRHV